MILMSALTALEDREAYFSLQEVATQHHLSQGYLEEIARLLKQAGLIEGRQGPGGGYRLTRTAKDITAEQILYAMEGPIQLVDCQQGPGTCPVEGDCSSKSLWALLQARITQTLHATTLEDILQTKSSS